MRKPFNGNYKLGYGFGYPPGYGGRHDGQDYATPSGTQLVAAMSGRVIFSGNQPTTAGQAVTIQNGNLLAKTFHMSERSVSVGQQVTEGQVIGKSGNTGNSTGPHVHFQVEELQNGRWVAVDPNKYLSKGETMLSNDDRYKMWRMARLSDPNPDEVKGWQGMDDSTFTAHLWNNGGSQYKQRREDNEAWKRTGQQLSFDPAYEAMGGKPGDPLRGDTSGIPRVLDDFRANKAANEDAQKFKKFVAVDNEGTWKSVGGDMSKLEVVKKGEKPDSEARKKLEEIKKIVG